MFPYQKHNNIQHASSSDYSSLSSVSTLTTSATSSHHWTRPPERTTWFRNQGYQQTLGESDDQSDGQVDQAESEDDVTQMDENSSLLEDRNKRWDAFKVTSNKASSISETKKCISANIILKITFCVILFLLVLTTATLSKLTFLLMTYHLRPGNLSTVSEINKIYDVNAVNHVVKVKVKWVWALLMVMCAPYCFTTCSYLWKLIFKKRQSLNCVSLAVALVSETIHTIGLSILVFYVIPSLDPLLGALVLLNIAIIPGIMTIFCDRRHNTNTSRRIKILKKFLDVIMLLFHAGVIAIWTYKAHAVLHDLLLCICLPLSLIFTSVSWWENYVPAPNTNGKDSKPKGRTNEANGDNTQNSQVRSTTEANLQTTGHSKQARGIYNILKSIGARNIKITLITSFWKLILTLAIPAIFLSVGQQQCMNAFFGQQDTADGCSPFGNLQLDNDMDMDMVSGQLQCRSMFPFVVAAVNIISSIICYKAGKSACKILAQRLCFALPLLLSVPITIGILIASYIMPESITDVMQCGTPWADNVPDLLKYLQHNVTLFWIPASVAALISLVYIGGHVWFPSCARMAPTDKLFLKSLYCGILLDQSLMLNRRRDDVYLGENELSSNWSNDPSNASDVEAGQRPDGQDTRMEEDLNGMDTTPMIYICATMWHETRLEVKQMLMSVFRMDHDQSMKRMKRKTFCDARDDIKNYYEFEAHIFFDDAFEAHADDGVTYKVNDYVKELVRAMDDAASTVHKTIMTLPPPEKITTPYGGRLVWKLPGENTLTAHLKDKVKIRHRKRWSQVMYMYYLLGYRILDLNHEKLSPEQQKKKAENTFLLALDGDVDFQPEAVQILLDRMKKSRRIGAACGRIHPIGSGPMVWYQKFEYAISHWLQKSTEHVLGCVLCSPGCFSLFRASALMDDNVIKRYTTPPSEARHYIQYDQGEDRWLCTLMLQQGHRVEYCAASDSYTFAPEGFFEFFNQRRRWTPSTMANILDLIQHYRQTTINNEDISILYMCYQLGLFCSSVVTPGTIFMLIVGALSSVYPITITTSLMVNIIPVMIFVLLCFKASNNIQLVFAAILSILYALLMMIVLVGLIKQIAENGFCSISTIFLTAIAGIFIISALLHPMEFVCLLHGCLYFLAIPSMSMLLMIFSLTNLNNISWGTRETKTPEQPEPQNVVSKSSNKNVLQKVVGKFAQSESVESEYTCSFGNLFRCICCPRPNVKAEDAKLKDILNGIETVNERLSEMNVAPKTSVVLRDNRREIPELEPAQTNHRESSPNTDKIESSNKKHKHNELKNLTWINDEDLGKGKSKQNSTEENKFWEEMIKEYLVPLETNKEQKKKMEIELLEFRNKVCLAFLLINALFIILLFALEAISQESKNLSFQIPCNIEGIVGEKVQPISIAFTIVFGILLVLQFIAMLFHQYSTFLHTAAITNIREPPNTDKQVHGLVKNLCNFDEVLPDYSDDENDAVEDVEAIKPLYSKNKRHQGRYDYRRGRYGGHPTVSQAFQTNLIRLVDEIKRENINGMSADELYRKIQKRFPKYDKESIMTAVKLVTTDKLKL